MGPFDAIAHLPRADELEAEIRAGVRWGWRSLLLFAASAAILLATGIGEWAVAHPLATAAALAPYLVLVALFEVALLAARAGRMPVDLADEPGQPVDLAEQVARLLDDAGGARPRVYLTRSGIWAGITPDMTILLHRELVKSGGLPEIKAVLHHELGHRAQLRLRRWAWLHLVATVVIGLAIPLLLWPLIASPVVPTWLVALGGLAAPALLVLARWDSNATSVYRQRTELCCDLQGARAVSPRAMIAALLTIARLDRDALQRTIVSLRGRLSRLTKWEREKLARLEAERDDPMRVDWTEFDANRNGVLELDELARMLRWMRQWPDARLGGKPRAPALHTHPPMHERILFLLREDPTLRDITRALMDPRRPPA